MKLKEFALGLAQEIMIQWHQCKTTADHDRINPANDVDGCGIFLMGDAECLKRTLKAVDQVDCQGKDSDQVNDDEPEVLKGDIDAAVDILDSFVVAGIGDHAELVGKAHFRPEIPHVDAEEGENEDPQDGHIFGSPGSAGDFAMGVFTTFSTTVHQPEGDSLDGMEENKGVEAQGDDQDKLVFGHERRVDIEGAASVVGKELEVAGHVDDEEKDQEKAGEGHDHLLAQAGGK